MEISIVVPIYNTAQNAIVHLPSIITGLRHKYKDFELLFIIDNVDVDKQFEDLFYIKEKFKEIKIIQLNQNYGQHFATLCGYYLAKGEYIVCVDEDMTSQILEICNTGEYEHFDVFYFFYDKNFMYNSDIRRVLSNTYKYIIYKIVNLQRNSTFRIISKKLRDKILQDKHVFWNLDVMIFNNTNNIGSKELHLPEISDSDSGYNYKKLCIIAFEIAYEHNTLLMNMLFAIVPSLLIYFFSVNISASVICYILTLFLSCYFFKIKKKNMNTTHEKIKQAILD